MTPQEALQQHLINKNWHRIGTVYYPPTSNPRYTHARYIIPNQDEALIQTDSLAAIDYADPSLFDIIDTMITTKAIVEQYLVQHGWIKEDQHYTKPDGTGWPAIMVYAQETELMLTDRHQFSRKLEELSQNRTKEETLEIWKQRGQLHPTLPYNDPQFFQKLDNIQAHIHY